MNTPEKKPPPRALVILIATIATILAIPGGFVIALFIISIVLRI